MDSSVTAELHSLIHALSPPEKRYFKLFANFSGQKPQNNYVLLFDQLNAMPDYQPQELNSWLASTSFGGHLSTTANFLQRLLLRSLKLYHQKKKQGSKAREAYDFAHILLGKGKYRMARKYLHKARKLAQTIEASTLLLDILELEKQLLFKSATKKINERLESLQNEQLQQLALITEKTRITSLKDKHRGLRSKDSALRAPERALALEDLRDRQLAAIEPPQGFEAQLCYHALHSQIAIQARDYGKAHLEAAANIQLWESHPKRIQAQAGLFVQYLSDYLNTCILAFEKEEASRTLAKIRAVKVHTHDDKIELLKQSLSTQLVFCLNAGEVETGQEVITNIEQLLASHGEEIPLSRRFSFYYNITTFHFYSESYRKALSSLSHILNAANSDLRQGLQSFARIFQILLHYEIKNLDLAEYLLRSTRHLHKRRKQLFELEKEIFRALRTIIFAPNPSSVRDKLQQHYQNLLDLAARPTGKEPAGTWEFIIWLQSKLERRSLHEMYLERVTARWELSPQKE